MIQLTFAIECAPVKVHKQAVSECLLEALPVSPAENIGSENE